MKSRFQEILITQNVSTEFTDTGLAENVAWAYRLRGYNANYSPTESLPTFWQEVTTASPPGLAEEILMISPWNLQVVFDQPLANASVNTGHYLVNNGIGRPVSVNLIRQKRGVLLTYHNEIISAGGYQLTISDLSAESGITIPDSSYSFNWQEDTFPPQITGCEVTGSKKVRLDFSESIAPDHALDIANYLWEMPEVDKDNYLVSIEVEDNSVYLTLASEICAGNQAYYLRVEKITDLNGNRINNLGNKTYFTLTNSSLENMVAYPNPFYTGKYSEFRFASLPPGQKGEVWIYELTGELVYQSDISPRSLLDNYFAWNGKNNSGKQVSSGLYFYILQIGAELQRGKIAVIN